MKQDKFSATPLPFTVRIGVTGHRDITLTNELKSVLRVVLTKSIQSIINPKSKRLSTPLIYKIITPLADGADRIVAVEAMEVLNAGMEVVLPMMKQEYEKTFCSPELIVEFEKLMAKAANVTTLIKKPLLEQYPGQDIRESRRTAYRRVGNAVINNCDILIALWDGIANGKKGGTAEVVAMALEQKKPVIVISKTAPHTISVQPGDNLIRRTLQSYEFFYKCKLKKTEIDAEINDEIPKFFPPNVIGSLKPENIALVKEVLLPIYARASLIAKRHQKLYRRTGLAVFVLSPLAVAAVALGTLVHHLSWLCFLFEFIILLAILIAILYANSRSAHKKWIQNRYLTELIRIASFFTACGIRPTPINIPFHLRAAHRSDDWMIRVYDSIIRGVQNTLPYDEQEFKPLLQYINTCWITVQQKYHESKRKSAGKFSREFEMTGGLVFGLALVAAAVHLWLVISGFEFQYRWISEYIIFLAIALPSLGASIGAIRNHREYSRIAKRSENMAGLLKELLEESNTVGSMDELKKYLMTIEEIMLHESQDWLMLMNFVRIEPV
jgi:hypothetical protein